MTWTCKDGRVVEIESMTDSHLINSIKMLERNFEPSVRECVGLDEVVVHDIEDGSAAFYMGLLHCYESYIEKGIENWFPDYEPLMSEAKKRGLL